jgi:hypothetical protein
VTILFIKVYEKGTKTFSLKPLIYFNYQESDIIRSQV